MGWKGTLRTIGATARRIERDSIRRQKELARQQQQFGKMQAREQAAYEVDVYNNSIDQLVSLHKECAEIIRWSDYAKKSPPNSPTRTSNREDLARQRLSDYHPSLLDKIFKRTGIKSNALTLAINEAISADEKDYQDKIGIYNEKMTEYNEAISLASKILEGDLIAYKEAVEELQPYAEIAGLGSKIEIKFSSKDTLIISLRIHDETAIPRQTKSLLSSGKLSIKDTPIGKYNEIYQDYVCSAAIRIARDLFSILPVSDVIVNTIGSCLDEATGRKLERPLLSVQFVRDTMDDLNFELIDPSTSMSNFKHNMNFKKTTGFKPVEALAT